MKTLSYHCQEYVSFIHCMTFCKNIARIAKAALHKLPGKSSLNVRSVCLLWLVCPVCPVCPGCPVCFDDHNNHDDSDDHVYHNDRDHDDRDIHDDHLNYDDHDYHLDCDDHADHRIWKEVLGGGTKGSWRLSDQMHALPHQSLNLIIITHSISHSVTDQCRYRAARVAEKEILHLTM